MTRVIQPVSEHPIPFEQEEIDTYWEQFEDPALGSPPSVDEAHEEYTRTIADRDTWHVFRPTYPFGSGDVIFWHRDFGEGFKIYDEEGNWHTFVNLFADIVEQEGDCRDADYSGELMASGSHRQQCSECGDWWVTG